MRRAYTYQEGVEIAGVLYLRAADLARLLTVTNKYGHVTPQVLDNWIRRRAHNGFPDPPDIRYVRGFQSGMSGRLWDPEEVRAVLSWRERYRPSRGGAPRGDRNGSRRRLRGAA